MPAHMAACCCAEQDGQSAHGVPCGWYYIAARREAGREHHKVNLLLDGSRFIGSISGNSRCSSRCSRHLVLCTQHVKVLHAYRVAAP